MGYEESSVNIMAALPPQVIDPVADAIFAHYKAKYSTEPQRGYVGASSIGKPCERALWYQFRWAKAPEFSGRLYRLFQTGHLAEPRFNADLRAIGCTVFEVNPATGKQWSFTEPATGHHMRGNCDAIATGIPQAPKAPHVLEYKTASDKYFKIMQKSGVKEAKPEHFAQTQLYMKWSIDQFGADGCKRALYVTVNKNDEDIYTERLEFDAKAAQALIDKALRIITATEPPIGIGRDATDFNCKWCDYADICWGTALPGASCRTCTHATPELDGDARWSCAKHGADIPDASQREGCGAHRYIPILLHNFAKAVDVVGDNVVYQTADGGHFINGATGYASAEIHACTDKAMLTNERLVELRKQYKGRIVS